MKKIAFISLSIILVGIAYSFSFCSNHNKIIESQKFAARNVGKLMEKDTISIIGVGDMMLGTNYPSKAYLPPNDGKDILKPVEDILKNADLTFGNMEGCLLNSGGHVKRCSDPSKCYAFRMPEHYAGYLKDAGFDVVSLANNHMGDFGQPGRDKTLEVLKEKDIHFAGLLSHPKTVFEMNGITYGFCAFSPNRGTVRINNIANAQKIVKELESEVDIVIVSFHGGAEGSKHRHVTRKTEYFYGENRGNVYEFAHKVVDAGADVVFGHGPHVTRAAELYKDRFIIYSLGNFCTYGRFSLRGSKGVGPIIKLFTNKKGEFISGKVYSTMQKGEGGPRKDPENRAIKELQELTKSDFPNSKLIIKDDGSIIKK